MSEDTVLLHRDDPEREPLIGHVKVTREDWVNIARHILVNEGISQVKILTMSDRLEVSRSSFYWYFKSRRDLLDALLEDWEFRNTACIIDHCQLEAETIARALCNFFRCFVDPDLFDRGLDFAVREWARRDRDVRKRIDLADQKRLKAVTAMFEQHGYEAYEADCRARILYFMQLGYHALDVSETMQVRMSRLQGYLEGFCGRDVSPDEYADFVQFAIEKGEG